MDQNNRGGIDGDHVRAAGVVRLRRVVDKESPEPRLDEEPG